MFALPRRLSLTVFCSTVLWSPVRAQEPDTTMLAPVTVTATRVPIRLDLVAASVTVWTAAQLREAGYRTVADVLRATPAASVVETGSFGGQTSLFLRGGESDYVKVLLDGVALNQPGGAFDFADLSLENVERIEIARGPGSVLWGSDAMSGVIQIFTRTGAGPGRVTAGIRAGTVATMDVTAGMAGSAGSLAYAAEVGRFTSDGFLPFNNAYERSAGGARLRLTPDARTDVAFALRYGDQAYHYPTDGAGALVDSNTFRFERGPVWTLDLGYAVSSRLALRFAYGVRSAEQGIDDRADGPADTLGLFGFQSRERVRRATLGARADWRAGDALVSIGVDLERQRIDGRSESQSEFGPFPDSLQARRRNDALYVQALTGLEQPLTLQAGARLDVNGQHGRFATVRAGAVYRVSAATRLRASLGSGFKEPTFFENFARGFVRGNPELAPERTRSWEAGLEQRVGRATLSVTYFDQAFTDLIEFTFSPVPPDTLNYFNVTGATADGVEAELRAELGGGWTAVLSYTYLDTRVTHPGFDAGPDAAFAPGGRLLRRPTDAVVLQLHAPLGPRGHVALALRHTGDRDDQDFTTFPAARVTLPAMTRADVSAEYEIAVARGLGLTLSARVENVFGDDRREVANFPARGRVVSVGGRLRTGAEDARRGQRG
jgi:vitamin B12 transporter